MKWLVPLNKLTKLQTDVIDKIVELNDENHWVSGYAGSGKTIVLTHAITRVASENPRDSIGFITYTHALKDLVESGLSPAVRKRVEINTVDKFCGSPKTYDHLFVDEVQDLKDWQIDIVLEHSNHIVFAGDPDQSIHTNRVDPKDLNTLLLRPKKHMLNEIHRLSENSFDIATSVYPEAKMTSGASLQDAIDNEAKHLWADSRREETFRIYDEAVQLSEPGSPSAILLPEHNLIYQFASLVAEIQGLSQPPKPVPIPPKMGHDYTAFNAFFKKAKEPLMFLGSGFGSFSESDTKPLVYILTYHSSKGLDFVNTFLPYLDEKTKIKQNYNTDDQGRRLFFVATTRSRWQQHFSHTAGKHEYLDLIPDHYFDEL